MTKSQELTEQVIELTNKQIEEMKALETERKKALEEEKYEEGAASVKSVYDAYIKAGFTEEQAWKLLAISMKNALKGGF